MPDCDYVYLKGKRIARDLVVFRDDDGLEYVLPPHEDQARTGLDRYGREYVSAAEAGRRGLVVGIIVSDYDDGEPDIDSVAWDVCEFHPEEVYGAKGRKAGKKRSKNGTLFDDIAAIADDAQRDLVLTRFLQGISYGKPTKGSLETVLGCLEGISREKVYDLLAFSNVDYASEGGTLGNVLAALAGVDAHPEYLERLETLLQSEPVLAYCMHHSLTTESLLSMRDAGESRRSYDKRRESLRKLEEVLERAAEGGAGIMSIASDCVEAQGWSVRTVAALGRAGVDPKTWEDLSGFSSRTRVYYDKDDQPYVFRLMAETGIPAKMWERVAFDGGSVRVPAAAVAMQMAELFPADSERRRIQPSVLTALSLLHATVNEVDEEYEYGEKSGRFSHLTTDTETYGKVTGNGPVQFGQMPGIDLADLLRKREPEQAALGIIGKTLAATEHSERDAHDDDDTDTSFVKVGSFSRARELTSAELREELSRFVEFDADGKPVRFLRPDELTPAAGTGGRWDEREVYEYTDDDVRELGHLTAILDTEWLLGHAYDRAAAIPALCLAQSAELAARVDDSEIASRVSDVPSDPASAKALVVALRKQHRQGFPGEREGAKEAETVETLRRVIANPAATAGEVHEAMARLNPAVIVSPAPAETDSPTEESDSIRGRNRRAAARVIRHVNDRFGQGFFAETVAGLSDATPEELAAVVKEAETVETLRRVLANPAATADVLHEAETRLNSVGQITNDEI